jgi:hypothetical protein
MRGVIKGVLAEELGNSLRMARGYAAALKKLPQGCLAVREIRGHRYYYLVKRTGKKVRYIYKGQIADSEKKKYQQAKMLRAKYRGLLSQAKKQIRFLRSSLRGKETV